MAKRKAKVTVTANNKPQQSTPAPSETEVNSRLARFRLSPLTETPAEDEVALALFECMKAIEVQLWTAGRDWTNGARIWTEATLAGLFKNVIDGGRRWRIRVELPNRLPLPNDRSFVLLHLKEIVDFAITIAGPNNDVDVHHASVAFERLRCSPRDQDSHPMFWCEP